MGSPGSTAADGLAGRHERRHDMPLDIDKIMDQAVQAAREFSRLDQATTDRIVRAAYEAGFDARVDLAEMAVAETRLGVVADKVIKNAIATWLVHEDIRGLRTAGVIAEDHDHGIVEIAQPMGPIFAVTPITNPTSTTLFKVLIALKSRNPLIIRPHGAAKKCSITAARICYEAALAAGAPEHCIQWVKRSSQQETLDMMAHRKTALILATGSVELVRAAHRSGTPTIGVGPGNVPAYIGKSADVPFAVEQIVKSKTFDNGTVCASEQAVVIRALHAEQAHAEFARRGAYFVTGDEVGRLSEVAFNATQRIMRTEVIGQPATRIAEMAGIDVPPETTLLMAELDDVGLHSPLSHEILAPILASYTAADLEHAIDLCRRINRHGGLGHTASIFSRNEAMIERFAEEMNAGRILVNTPASQGALGGTYNALQPSLTLGCGAGGKNITTDNISARHLINIQRVARRKVAARMESEVAHLLDPAFSARDLERDCNRG
ncbi:aldehyde dehydrogenase family protein [bacterium]|nr:aldehyde dehydrogenase family protein [bacterium]MBU1072512.1 aldehyde dehydrogenase family protein [bacterium]MBU1676539.1 aldehyde dehydrogenase family protein [bacterium]